MTPQEQALHQLGADPVLAHNALFRHRHPETSQTFHDIIIRDWWSEHPRVLDMVFRGGGKSTVAEEAITLLAAFRRFHNALIIGETETRAKERLASIKHELETNEDIEALFGPLVGPVWQEKYIELSNGVVIQAYGRGQSLRGVKHLQYRPDIAFLDDLEDEESTKTEEARQKTLDWFTKTLLPALTPRARVRMAATPLHPKALAVKLLNSTDWLARKFPITYLDPLTAELKSSWPDRYPLEWIEEAKRSYVELGQLSTWAQEYMCEAENPEDKVFTPDMIRVEPLLKQWQATYAVYDPARTVKSTSATTGKVVGSWIGNKLVLWEAQAKYWKPDEIIDDMFRVDNDHAPVVIGVEEDGLHEFIMQPLRQAQTTRRHTLPIRALKAPKGKIDFIRSLQPFFKAGEVVFAGDRQSFADLEQQLLAFPQGKIDAPNALAYFLKLRPGVPMYESFNTASVVEYLKPIRSRPMALAVNATGYLTTGVLIQIVNGILFILGDFVREGDPGTVLGDIVREAGLVAQRAFTLTAPPLHFQAYDVIGLRPAARRLNLEVSRGGQEVKGREQLRSLIETQRHNLPAFQISPDATWTLRALTGGYARKLGADFAEEGAYRVLMEGLEAWAALLASGFQGEDDKDVNYGYTADGRRFVSAMAGRG